MADEYRPHTHAHIPTQTYIAYILLTGSPVDFDQQVILDRELSATNDSKDELCGLQHSKQPCLIGKASHGYTL